MVNMENWNAVEFSNGVETALGATFLAPGRAGCRRVALRGNGVRVGALGVFAGLPG